MLVHASWPSFLSRPSLLAGCLNRCLRNLFILTSKQSRMSTVEREGVKREEVVVALEEVSTDLSKLVLSAQECVFSWMTSGGAGGRANRPQIKSWITDCIAYEENAMKTLSAMLESPSAFFVRRCMKAVYAGQDGNPLEALKIMDGLLLLADKELRGSTGATCHHVEGIMNLLRANRKAIQQYFEIPEEAARFRLALTPRSPMKLSNTARALVLSHKTMFLKYVGAKGELVEQTIRQAYGEDPEQAEVLLILSRVLRSRRRSSEERIGSGPSSEELWALTMALERGKEKNFRESAYVSVLQTLGDILEQPVGNPRSSTLDVRRELMEELRGEALILGNKRGASVRALIVAAFVLGDRRMGKEGTRDLNKTREFLKRALEMWPSNVKAQTLLQNFKDD